MISASVPGEVERDGDRDEGDEEVGPPLAAEQEAPHRGEHTARRGARNRLLRRQELGALLELGRVRPGVLDALRVLLRGVRRRRPSRTRRPTSPSPRRRGHRGRPARRAGRAGPAAAWCRTGLDLLVLTELGQRQVEVDAGLAAGPGRVLDVERERHAAQDRVVLARLDLDRGGLDGVLDLLDLLVGELLPAAGPCSGCPASRPCPGTC